MGQTRYLVNAFSLNMLPEIASVTVTLRIRKLAAEEFCSEVRDAVNAIGHPTTMSVINALCSTNLAASRIEVRLGDGDELVVFQVKTRLPEGKILSADEIRQMMQSKQVELLKVKVEIKSPT
ncbi:MAG: DUF1874 domain-containing protein [Candidatus Bathyarchaeia archaeon]